MNKLATNNEKIKQEICFFFLYIYLWAYYCYITIRVASVTLAVLL